jgi:hypothetical protein
MTYMHKWVCDRCGDEQRSVDRPKFRVCDRCVGASGILVAEEAFYIKALAEIARSAYERGYKHGKAVAVRPHPVTRAEVEALNRGASAAEATAAGRSGQTEPDDRTDRLIEEMDSLLRQAREFIVREYPHDPDMPEIVDEIDAFLEGK